MSTSSPTPTCCPTTDSPLSTTASIVGILTFALGLFASYIALHTSTRSAPTEIARLIADLRSTQHEINRVAEYIFADHHLSDHRPSDHHLSPSKTTVGKRYGSDLYNEVQTLLRDCIRLFYEADDLLKRSEEQPEKLWQRVRFLLRKDEVGEKMARLVGLTGKLGGIQMTLFLRKSAAQDAMLRRVVRYIEQGEDQG